VLATASEADAGPMRRGSLDYLAGQGSHDDVRLDTFPSMLGGELFPEEFAFASNNSPVALPGDLGSIDMPDSDYEFEPSM